jgi:hypothetical protein
MARSALNSNPKITRRNIQTAYERYVLGVDRFPRFKFAKDTTEEDLARFPRKTQPVAQALARTWALIDEDEAWWADSLGILGEMVATKVKAGSFDAPVCSMVRVGLNVVRLGILKPSEDPAEARPVFMAHAYRTEEFMQQFEGVELNLSGDRKIKIEDGRITGDSPDVGVVRGSNTSLLYRPESPGEPLAV